MTPTWSCAGNRSSPWSPFRLAGVADDERQKAFLDRINASKRVFLSSTTIDGRYLVRACIVSHRTHADRIEECIDIVQRAAADLVG